MILGNCIERTMGHCNTEGINGYKSGKFLVKIHFLILKLGMFFFFSIVVVKEFIPDEFFFIWMKNLSVWNSLPNHLVSSMLSKKKKHNRTKILINPNFKQMPNKKHIQMFIWKTQAKRTYRSAENKYILSIKTIALCETRV